MLRRLLMSGVLTLMTSCLLGQSVIVDNADPGFTVTAPATDWLTGTAAGGKYGPDYRFANTASGAPTTTATWTPTLPSTGYYYIFTQYPQGGNRAPDSPFTVVGDLVTSTVLVN